MAARTLTTARWTWQRTCAALRRVGVGTAPASISVTLRLPALLAPPPAAPAPAHTPARRRPPRTHRAMTSIDNVYGFDNFQCTGRVCKTNTPASTSMRAPGNINGVFAMESVIHAIATSLGKDATDVAAANFVRLVRTSRTVRATAPWRRKGHWRLLGTNSPLTGMAATAGRRHAVRRDDRVPVTSHRLVAIDGVLRLRDRQGGGGQVQQREPVPQARRRHCSVQVRVDAVRAVPTLGLLPTCAHVTRDAVLGPCRQVPNHVGVVQHVGPGPHLP